MGSKKPTASGHGYDSLSLGKKSSVGDSRIGEGVNGRVIKEWVMEE